MKQKIKVSEMKEIFKIIEEEDILFGYSTGAYFLRDRIHGNFLTAETVKELIDIYNSVWNIQNKGIN